MKNSTSLLNFFNDLQGNADFTNYSLEEMKSAITTINDNYLDDWESLLVKDNDSDNTRCLEILTVCLEAVDCDFSELEFYEFFEHLNNIKQNFLTSSEFCMDLLCGEVRLIHNDEIDQIWSDSLRGQIKDCYELPDELPSFFVIDWDQTVENCKVDGLGHHFGSYDGEAYQSNHYNIFRTN
jgi:hypothetical protein